MEWCISRDGCGTGAADYEQSAASSCAVLDRVFWKVVASSSTVTGGDVKRLSTRFREGACNVSVAIRAGAAVVAACKGEACERGACNSKRDLFPYSLMFVTGATLGTSSLPRLQAVSWCFLAVKSNAWDDFRGEGSWWRKLREEEREKRCGNKWICGSCARNCYPCRDEGGSAGVDRRSFGRLLLVCLSCVVEGHCNLHACFINALQPPILKNGIISTSFSSRLNISQLPKELNDNSEGCTTTTSRHIPKARCISARTMLIFTIHYNVEG